MRDVPRSAAWGKWWAAGSVLSVTLPVRLAPSDGSGEADDRGQTVLKTERFDNDPGWDGHNNCVVPKLVKTVHQGCGYRTTNFAGKEKGEIGGTIWRSATPAYYAAEIPTRTL